MSYKFFHLQSLVTVAVCLIVAASFTGCSDKDDPKPAKAIEGEWISTSGIYYYQFLSDGTGRYICLADEPGYDPEYPDAAIQKPVDPYYFDYTVEGDILTMKEYYDTTNKDEYSIYVCEFVVSKNVLQIRWDSDSSWDTYNRWTPRK